MRWSEGRSGSTEIRNIVGQQNLNDLVDGPCELIASPITIAEYTSVLHDFVRTDKPWGAYFTEEAAEDCLRKFMGFLSDGSIAIKPLGRRAYEVGLAYVTYISRLGRRMRGWDAIHLYEACRWAREVDQQVSVATSDPDFRKVISVAPEFGRYVEPLDITQPLGT